MRHGGFSQTRIEGPDGLTAVVWRPADLPAVLVREMTEGNRWWASELQALWTAADRCPGVSRDPDAIGGGSETDGPQATRLAMDYAEAARMLKRHRETINAGCHPAAWFLLHAVLHERRPWRDLIGALDFDQGYAVHVIVQALSALDT